MSTVSAARRDIRPRAVSWQHCRRFSVLLRLYGPLEPSFDKSWKPGDFEVVE
jgi:hypothetical protein